MAERGKYVGKVITDDDETIAAALEGVSIPTLMMSMIHMSGDTAILQGPLKPAGVYLNEVQGFMSPEDQSAVRAMALDIIKDYRDRGSIPGTQPDNETLQAMMSFLVAEPVAAEYVPMMLEELELDGRDARDLGWGDAICDEVKAGFHVVVIGCGMSGLLAAIRLDEAGIPFTVIEKNAGPGGTWFENRYPGCRVDVGNHFYCYSFEPNNEWTEFFAQHSELQHYFEGCMAKYGVANRIQFESEVTSARYNESTHTWTVNVRRTHSQTGTSTVEIIEANAIISAVGNLNRPKLPDIVGLDRFGGEVVHSAKWPTNLDLRGKRVAVIGTGASAFQIVPAIAEQVEHLTVFQRSASWMFPNPNYHESVNEGTKWALEHLPYYGRWYRFLLFWPGCDGGLQAMRIDPDWPHQDRSISEVNEVVREMFTQYMADQITDDAELLTQVVPDYVCLGKRTLQDNGSWLAALQRDDVELVTDSIVEVQTDRVITASGSDYPVDVIVCATGFYANRYLWPMEIIGRDGIVLSDQWGDEPTAYLGMTVPHFPNMFCLYGPGTNLAHGGSLIFHSECQIRYIMGCIAALLTLHYAAIECRAEIHDDYNQRLQAELATMVWSHPTITNSFFRNNSGKIHILSPWRLVDYWTWTREPDLSDFVLSN